MKRIGNLFEQICSFENLELADHFASKGKLHKRDVQQHLANKEANLLAIRTMLLDKSFKNSPYSVFKVYEPKERDISNLPYYPDRIIHHAIMLVLEPYFNKWFTNDSYSCIKGKGIHAASRAVKRSLRSNRIGTEYCLKLDIKKFYPNIDHSILKQLLCRKIKDSDLLWLLDEIIDSTPGLPIGNYLSQYFANFYLTGFDRFVKQQLGVKHYIRYADDMVILGSNKEDLHSVLAEIRYYLHSELKLTLKSNYQIFPVEVRGIDVVGYVHYHNFTLLRKSIKQNFARKLVNGCSPQTVASYMGWAKHCNSRNLLRKLNVAV